MTAPGLDGVLVIDKPRGPTSHDVVWRLRKALRVRAIGHAGTLDPMATGILVAAIGEATKLVPWLTAHDKSYEATIALGVETDTLDAEGLEVRRVPPSAALLEALREAEHSRAGTMREDGAPGGDATDRDGSRLPEVLREAFDQERTRTLQAPPAFSAIRTGGERAFTRARRGEQVELEPRPVLVHRLDLVTWRRGSIVGSRDALSDASNEISLDARSDALSLDVSLDVAKGYYVRALARDLAIALGTAGHLTALRRTRSGCFGLADACALDRSPEDLRAAVVPLALAAARAMPIARLSEAGARDARHGRPVLATDMETGNVSPLTPCAWLDAAGDLVAVGQLEEAGHFRVLRGFGGESSSSG